MNALILIGDALEELVEFDALAMQFALWETRASKQAIAQESARYSGKSRTSTAESGLASTMTLRSASASSFSRPAVSMPYANWREGKRGCGKN